MQGIERAGFEVAFNMGQDMAPAAKGQAPVPRLD